MENLGGAKNIPSNNCDHPIHKYHQMHKYTQILHKYYPNTQIPSIYHINTIHIPHKYYPHTTKIPEKYIPL